MLLLRQLPIRPQCQSVADAHNICYNTTTGRQVAEDIEHERATRIIIQGKGGRDGVHALWTKRAATAAIAHCAKSPEEAFRPATGDEHSMAA